MEEKLECAARVTVRSAAARSIKSYKGGDAVLSGNKGENDLQFLGPINSSLQSFTCKTTCLPPPPRNGLVHWSQQFWLGYRGVSIHRNACWTTSHYLFEGHRGHERGIVLLSSFIHWVISFLFIPSIYLPKKIWILKKLFIHNRLNIDKIDINGDDFSQIKKSVWDILSR